MSSTWKRGFGWWGVGILTFLSVDLPSTFFARSNHFKGLQEDLDDSQSRFSNTLKLVFSKFVTQIFEDLKELQSEVCNCSKILKDQLKGLS